MPDDLGDLLRNWNPDDGEGRPESENIGPRALREREVQVLGLWAPRELSEPDGPIVEAMVLLRDSRGRRLPIHIGPFEAMAIQDALAGHVPERPLTHDLLRLTIERLGGVIERVVIDDLWHSTFYAKVHVAHTGGEVLEIDARPSDAIALALRARATIYVAEDVLEQYAQADLESEE